MSGGQHNPNGRPAQLGSAWNHLQLQTQCFGRLPQAAHLGAERVAGVTWHTPTPPLHPYHAPVSPDTQQTRKTSIPGGATVYRHTPTPPDRDSMLYRHTPTPPDKLYRHTPSPGDPKVGGVLPPAEIYPIPLQPRDKLRAEELLAYARGGVDLTLGRPATNGAPLSLSVRDAPTINSLIGAGTVRTPRPAHTRVDAILERLTPQPHSPQSVIVHPRAALSPSPPHSEDSMDSCGAPPGSKRKRKPERILRVPVSPVPLAQMPQMQLSPARPVNTEQTVINHVPSPVQLVNQQKEVTVENGDVLHEPKEESNGPQLSHSRRKTKSGSAETIDDIAAMIASTDQTDGKTADRPVAAVPADSSEPSTTIETLKSVLGSPDAMNDPQTQEPSYNNPTACDTAVPEIESPENEVAKISKRRSTRSSRSDVSSSQDNQTSDAKRSEEVEKASDTKKEESTTTIVDVENQLEQMFAGIEEQKTADNADPKENPPKKKRKSRGEPKSVKGKGSRRSSAAASTDEGTSAPRKKINRKKMATSRGMKKETSATLKDAYDSGSNASSSRSRGPYVQIRGPRDSPLSVNIVNVTTGEDESEAVSRAKISRRKGSADGEFRNGLKSRGLHCSTLSMRYDATTPDSSWVCAFCELGPHASVKERLEGPARPLGDLFGPYTVSTDCDEYRSLDEARRKWHSAVSTDKNTCEVWFHEDCGLWAPGLIAAGGRLTGLRDAVWGARSARCGRCGRPGAGVSCAARACPARAHVNCARTTHWTLYEDDFRALCPRHSTT